MFSGGVAVDKSPFHSPILESVIACQREESLKFRCLRVSAMNYCCAELEKLHPFPKRSRTYEVTNKRVRCLLIAPRLLHRRDYFWHNHAFILSKVLCSVG